MGIAAVAALLRAPPPVRNRPIGQPRQQQQQFSGRAATPFTAAMAARSGPASLPMQLPASFHQQHQQAASYAPQEAHPAAAAGAYCGAGLPQNAMHPDYFSTSGCGSGKGLPLLVSFSTTPPPPPAAAAVFGDANAAWQQSFGTGMWQQAAWGSLGGAATAPPHRRSLAGAPGWGRPSPPEAPGPQVPQDAEHRKAYRRLPCLVSWTLEMITLSMEEVLYLKRHAHIEELADAFFPAW